MFGDAHWFFTNPNPITDAACLCQRLMNMRESERNTFMAIVNAVLPTIPKDEPQDESTPATYEIIAIYNGKSYIIIPATRAGRNWMLNTFGVEFKRVPPENSVDFFKLVKADGITVWEVSI
jgi:hypothetical protein